MESALARQPRDSSAALRVRRAVRAPLGVAAVTVSAALLWLAPLHRFHLLPVPVQADPETRTVASRLPTTVAASQGTATAGNTLPPTLPPAKVPVQEPVAAGSPTSPIIKATVQAASAGPVLLVGRISDGKEAVSLNVEPLPRPLPIPSPAVEPAVASSTPAGRSEMASAVISTASPPIDGVPEARPPLPLVTDLIEAKLPEANSVPQSNASPPAALPPAGKPRATEHRG